METLITQYIKPRGYTRIISVKVPDECKGQLEKIAAADLRITCEALRRGMAAQYLSHKDGDFTTVISLPGCAQDELVKMIMGFDEEAFKAWSAKTIEDETDGG